MQAAYRRNHSTETALLKVVNDILSNMNTHHVTVLACMALPLTGSDFICLDALSESHKSINIVIIISIGNS